MQSVHSFGEVAAAYDAIAPSYDSRMADEAWMRPILWRHYARLFSAGARVVDAGCGTGIDALFLAERDVHVTAVDLSPGMIAQLERKARAADLAHRLDTHVLDVIELNSLPAATYDGIVAAFAVVNTLHDVGGFARTAARLLRPGGRLVVHGLSRGNLWRRLRAVRAGHWTHVLTAPRTYAVKIAGHTVEHRLYAPGALYREHFAELFRLQSAYALGVLRPPATAPIPQPFVALLGGMEPYVRSCWPFRAWGRFFVLDCERREQRNA